MIRITVKTFLVVVLFSSYLTGQEIPDNNEPQDTTFVMQKSPWGAVLRSAIIPGFGQFYNESYWKIPVIWGVGALLISGWVYYNDLYTENKDLYISSGNELYRNRRDFYRDQRDNFTIYLVITYLLNLVDAYVDAHLFDFQIEDNPGTNSLMVNVRFNF